MNRWEVGIGLNSRPPRCNLHTVLRRVLLVLVNVVGRCVFVADFFFFKVKLSFLFVFSFLSSLCLPRRLSVFLNSEGYVARGEMEKPFYGRTGALEDARQGLPVAGSRFASARPGKWFPSLLTVPQRVLHGISEGDGVDCSIFRFLGVACVYEELRKRHADGTSHGALLRDVLNWHQASFEEVRDCRCAAADVADGVFRPYLPAYNICVLKEGQLLLSHAAVSRRAVTLVGRDRVVNDILTDHTSCSAQHAALEVRFVYAHAETLDQQITACMEGREIDWGSAQDVSKLCVHVREAMEKLGDGEDAWLMELQVLDLGSTNGTRLNGERLRPFVPTTLIEGDILTFGFSTRSYVVVRP